jgi:hypothetical protein
MNETQRERAVLVAKLRDRERLLEEARTAFKKLRPFIYCDMGEECAEHGHWEDCATNVAGKILDDIEAKLGASNQ